MFAVNRSTASIWARNSVSSSLREHRRTAWSPASRTRELEGPPHQRLRRAAQRRGRPGDRAPRSSAKFEQRAQRRDQRHLADVDRRADGGDRARSAGRVGRGGQQREDPAEATSPPRAPDGRPRARYASPDRRRDHLVDPVLHAEVAVLERDLRRTRRGTSAVPGRRGARPGSSRAAGRSRATARPAGSPAGPGRPGRADLARRDGSGRPRAACPRRSACAASAGGRPGRRKRRFWATLPEADDDLIGLGDQIHDRQVTRSGAAGRGRDGRRRPGRRRAGAEKMPRPAPALVAFRAPRRINEQSAPVLRGQPVGVGLSRLPCGGRTSSSSSRKPRAQAATSACLTVRRIARIRRCGRGRSARQACSEGGLHAVDVVGVDHAGLAQLVRGSGELREHQRAVLVVAARDVLLGDEVHAVAVAGSPPSRRRRGRARPSPRAGRRSACSGWPAGRSARSRR